MRVHAQLMMVISLDKCIGCHACSVACKQSWTERAGSEHIWFNNVETRPGRGYPGRWEDRARWGGGWERDGGGRLRLRAEMRRQDLRRLFRDRSQSVIDDYYEPWANEPSELVDAPLAERPPTAGPRSIVTRRPLAVKGGPNWDDQLAGMDVDEDPNLSEEQARQVRQLEKVFMLYLPRICNHCLNPSCAAVCPSRAIYKRVSDGVVLVDEERCRKQGLCEQGCPYRKVYINRLSGKAEKCMFCLPGVTEDGLPTLCSESCVGRVRSVGVVLYDPESVVATASVSDHSLVEAQREALLDPGDESVISAAERSGIPTAWVEAARRSPVYALAKELRVALPLHPEFRTLPMVWYVPPLSPLLDRSKRAATNRPIPSRCSRRWIRCVSPWTILRACCRQELAHRWRRRLAGWSRCAASSAISRFIRMAARSLPGRPDSMSRSSSSSSVCSASPMPTVVMSYRPLIMSPPPAKMRLVGRDAGKEPRDEAKSSGAEGCVTWTGRRRAARPDP